MDGITILNEIVTPIKEISNLTTCVFILIISIILSSILWGAITYILLKLDGRVDKVKICTMSLIGTFLGAILGGMLFAEVAKEEKIGEKITYEVTIDDTISMTEFNKRYNIIEQRGKIYVIEEKITQENNIPTS